MRLLLFLFVFFFLLGSCNPPAVPPRPFPPIDTSLVELHDFAQKREDTCWLSEAGYFPFYIGPETDTIVLDRCRIFYFDTTKRVLADRYEKYNVKRERLPSRRAQESSPVSIRIDTVRIIRNGYAVVLKNEGKDSIQVGYDEYIPLLLEAKDSAGIWRAIEKDFNIGCGTGMRFWILPPGEIACTFAPVTSGSFKTILRLRFENHYSAPFSGSINYRQFENKFNDEGNFKPAYLQERKAQHEKEKNTR